MAPKTNDKGGKSIMLISKQSNRMLHVTTPLMTTWGIADFVDERGESDGKYSISLNFPGEDYATAGTTAFLKKCVEFQEQVLDDAVKNSELWWGEEMSRELCKHTFFPFLKYSKNKDTKKFDYTKPPSIRPKVPCYNGKWGVEIYDTKQRLIFPSDNPDMTPMDFVPKLSSVACGLQCTGIWIGGKGWGLTWKIFQCVVKPREIESIQGRCHIELSDEDVDTMEKQEVVDPVTAEEMIQHQESTSTLAAVKQAVNTQVDDSDDEQEQEVAAEILPTPPPVLPTVVQKEEEETVAEVVVPKKKVVKSATPASVPVEETHDEPTKKKVIKKKVVAV
jgi:hypothetical protein